MKPETRHILHLGLTVCAILTLLACEKATNRLEDRIHSIVTPYYEVEFSIDESYLSGFQIFKEESVHNNIGAVLAAAGMSDDDIEKVVIKEAELILKDGGSYPDFDMLKYVELTMYTDSLGEDVIAWLNPVPADRTSLTLNLSEEDVIPYFRVDDFILTAQGFLKERLAEEILLQARIKFQVE
jgi:hypothetical protein